MYLYGTKRLGDASQIVLPVIPDAAPSSVFLIGGALALALGLWWIGAARKTVRSVRTASRRREATAKRKAALREELARL